MKTLIPPKVFSVVIEALVVSGMRSATKFIDPKTVVRATWRQKPAANHRREEMVVTFGAPNYLEAEFVRRCAKSGEPFPVKKVQFRPWPKRKEK